METGVSFQQFLESMQTMRLIWIFDNCSIFNSYLYRNENYHIISGHICLEINENVEIALKQKYKQKLETLQ